MKKIASPQDLQVELRQLLSHCVGQDKLSRGRVAATLNSMADRLAADSKVEKALKGYLHHVKGTKPKYQPPKSLTEHVKRALAQGEDEQRKALKGIIHHNQGTKEEYQLPDSLMRQLKSVTATLNSMADRLVEAKLADPEAKAAKELDKKLQSLMQQALLSPRQVGELQKVIEATLKKHPSKKAGLVTAMDSDQEDLYDALWMIASNDGDSYRKKDARGAVKKAWMEWQKSENQQHREDFRAVEKKLVKDLGDRWKKGEV